MPPYGALKSSFTVNGVVHDPLTGLDTGSGNDRITTGLGEDNSQPALVVTALTATTSF